MKRNHENTKTRKHEEDLLLFFVVSWFRGFVVSWLHLYAERGREGQSDEAFKLPEGRHDTADSGRDGVLLPGGNTGHSEVRCDDLRRGAAHYRRRQRADRGLRVHRREHSIHARRSQGRRPGSGWSSP